MFGLVADERVYLKVSDANRADFEAEGAGPFVWVTPDGKEMMMSYFELPDRLYDDPEELKVWAMKALDVALGVAAKKTAKARRPAAPKPKPRSLSNTSKRKR
jgi:DNA transformation protein